MDGGCERALQKLFVNLKASGGVVKVIKDFRDIKFRL